MNKKLINTTLLVITLIVGIVYGIIIHKYEIFPYQIIKKTFHLINRQELVTEEAPITNETSNFYDLWSIGIYEGSTPFDLAASEHVSNPIISAVDVTDVEASYVADPFMLIEADKYYSFFEVFNWNTYQGDIGYAISADGYNWEYKKIIIDETFHLSYPYIFKNGNDYYMIPESNKDLSVRLYKAISFPDKWEYVDKLISGYHYTDPSIFQHNGMWWLFVGTAPNDGVMNLYYSSKLLGEWKSHPMNPIVRYDKQIARPAGRIFSYNDRHYRLGQDNYTEYGLQVFAFEIAELTSTTYVESDIYLKPIVIKSGNGWNGAGMHHVDLYKLDDKWIAIVDGKKIIEKPIKTLRQSNLPEQ